MTGKERSCALFALPLKRGEIQNGIWGDCADNDLHKYNKLESEKYLISTITCGI